MTQVAGHPRERIGSEDHKDQQADYNDLLATDTEHGIIITAPYDFAIAFRVL
jgi:hypothetical protein